ncbi:hypothetical protein ACJJTC_016893 [Scirpophaga incertulas]
MNTIDLTYDSDSIIDQNDFEFDISMPLPDIEYEPQLLISKVRKHYMNYLIKLLTINYENSHKLLNKNLYLPSAIWKCAKIIEANATQSCMVTQLYRKNIVPVIKCLKQDINKGKLNRKLLECLRKAPENDKSVQTMSTLNNNCDCQCLCNKRKKRRQTSQNNQRHRININDIDQNALNIPSINLEDDKKEIDKNSKPLLPFTANNKCDIGVSPILSKTSTEPQDTDELTLQLQKLFYSDNSQEDELFESRTYDAFDNFAKEKVAPKTIPIETITSQVPESIIENHAAQIKSLDERLASLTGLLLGANNENISTTLPEKIDKMSKNVKVPPSKWLCEEYFHKSELYDLLYEMGGLNRQKLAKIKQTLLELFGENSEDEDNIMSPLDETSDFIISCKQRITPWVVNTLTPLYVKGRIKDKTLFKLLTRHLLKIIYKCSKYPKEYEVNNFVSDFMENHKVIECEADFMKFKIHDLY